MRKIIIIISVVGLMASLYSCSSRQSQFDQNQQSMIMNDTTNAMRVWQITNANDSILLRRNSEKAIPDSTDKILQTLITRMHKTVTNNISGGVGIAAPQVGILKQIIWVQRFDKKGVPFEVYLNPKIKQYSKLTQECREGCLSIPDRIDTLNSRSYAILIEYYTQQGEYKIEMVEDFTAVIFQHEIDHLNGILYTDHLEEAMRKNSNL
ncbi:MAG: peptide deformylase [Salinivirgaceae bacterium]|jgi:peptide deformylase|nr:peptide deformylase [Salinivirgaceae bacterium]